MQPPRFLNITSLSLIVAIASVVVPLWLWKADLSSKSVSVRVLSQTSLQPETANAFSGLRVTVDGVSLTRPFLSTVEITNDGDRPITQGDYESAIQFKVQPGITVVRAQVASAKPEDLEVKLTWDTQELRMAPLLLNPTDTVRVAILTSGEKPAFTPRARIAGVPQVAVDDVSSKDPGFRVKAGLLIGALLMLIASDMTNEGLFSKRALILRRRSAILVSILTGFAGVSLFMLFLGFVGVRELWQVAVSFIPLLIVTGIGAAIWNWTDKKDHGKDGETT